MWGAYWITRHCQLCTQLLASLAIPNDLKVTKNDCSTVLNSWPNFNWFHRFDSKSATVSMRSCHISNNSKSRNDECKKDLTFRWQDHTASVILPRTSLSETLLLVDFSFFKTKNPIFLNDPNLKLYDSRWIETMCYGDHSFSKCISFY